MTGLECLRAELLERGFNKAQVTSKLVAAVLDIVANTNHVYSDMVCAERELEEVRVSVMHKKAEYMRREIELRGAEISFKRDVKGIKEYIDKFNTNLSECETEEGRDSMRRAQLFVNSVSVDSKYDNTAFIIGLAAILTNGKIGAMNELKKINPRLFDYGDYIDKLSDGTVVHIQL